MEYILPITHASPSPLGWLRNLFAAVAEVFTPSDARSKRRAMEDIIAIYDEMISRICFGYAHSKSEFEDIRQDVYVNIWQSIERFRGDASIKTWIYRIALNTCVSVVRARSKAGISVALHEVADIVDYSDEKAEKVAALYQSIEMLNPIDRGVVMLWLDELSYDEIAEAMGMTRNAVATRLHRAKEKLRLEVS